MLVGVIQSIILYAAPIWSEVIRIETYEELLISTQRKILIRTICAYTTTSAKAMHVISGVPPIILLIQERIRLHEREDSNLQSVKRDATLVIWQETYAENTVKTQWTKTLIPDIISWTKRWSNIRYPAR